MEWDHRDLLQRVELGGGGTAHYVHDSAGREWPLVDEISIDGMCGVY